MADDDSQGVQFRFELDGDQSGRYSNIVSVWHTPWDFTLDFGVAGLPQQDGSGIVVPVPIVARVKMPTSVVFQLAQAIAESVTKFEASYGAITPAPPDDTPLYPPPSKGDEPK